MVALWLPVIAAAVGVFIASSLLHMVLPYHRTDVKKLPVEKEDALLDAFARLGVAPDDYLVPHGGGPAGMRDPAFIAKSKKGPRVFFSLGPGEAPAMGPYLGLWFAYCVVVSAVVAYVVWRVWSPGTPFRPVFKLTSAIAALSYGAALPQLSIWYRRSWATTIKSLIDSLIYGLVTGAAFGWLWPQ